MKDLFLIFTKLKLAKGQGLQEALKVHFFTQDRELEHQGHKGAL